MNFFKSKGHNSVINPNLNLICNLVWQSNVPNIKWISASSEKTRISVKLMNMLPELHLTNEILNNCWNIVEMKFISIYKICILSDLDLHKMTLSHLWLKIICMLIILVMFDQLYLFKNCLNKELFHCILYMSSVTFQKWPWVTFTRNPFAY